MGFLDLKIIIIRKYYFFTECCVMQGEYRARTGINLLLSLKVELEIVRRRQRLVVYGHLSVMVRFVEVCSLSYRIGSYHIIIVSWKSLRSVPIGITYLLSVVFL